MSIRSQVSSGCAVVLCLVAASAQASITFGVNFSANAQTQLSAAQQQLFVDGLNFWGDVITGYRDGISRNWTLNVETFSQPAMSGSVLLGSAGPNGLAYSEFVADATTSFNRFILSTGGIANFNVHPDAGTLTFDTIAHEIGHALGIGTLWEDNQVYSDGVIGNSNRTLAGGTPGQYVGAAGLAAYQDEFDSAATFVPVELSGGVGTAHGHWDEADDFGQTNTGITSDITGFDLRRELMTGYAAPGNDFLSSLTIQSLYDIGYTVIPEPASLALLAGLGLMITARRRRAA